jgi:hypothetical protein
MLRPLEKGSLTAEITTVKAVGELDGNRAARYARSAD